MLFTRYLLSICAFLGLIIILYFSIYIDNYTVATLLAKDSYNNEFVIVLSKNIDNYIVNKYFKTTFIYEKKHHTIELKYLDTYNSTDEQLIYICQMDNFYVKDNKTNYNGKLLINKTRIF